MNSSIAREKFSNNLKILRLNANKSINQVSKETELAYSFLYDLETLKNPKNPSMETIDRLAAYYKVNVYELFI